MIAKKYQDMDIFEGLSTAQLEKIIALGELRSFKQHEKIFEEGQSATQFYVLLSGKVRIQVQLSSRPENLGITILSQPGQLVGWSGLVQPQSYTAAALCEEDCELLTMEGAELMKEFEADPVMGFIMMRKISIVIGTRLRTMQRTVLSTF